MHRGSEWISLRGRDVALLFFLLWPVTVSLAVCFVLQEDPAYVWDYRHYWTEFQRYGEMIGSGSLWWAEARTAVLTADYNPVAAILLAPVYILAGGSREVYVGAIAAVYLLPVALLAAVLAVRAGNGGRLAFVLAALLAVVFVPFWRPTLRGMVDIVGLLPLGGAFYLILFRGQPSNPKRLAARALTMGILLWLAFLLRRHFAYTILVLFALYAVIEILRAFAERHKPTVAIVRVLVSAVSVVAFLALALLAQWDLVVRAVTTDYSSLYRAYQQPFASQVDSAITRLGMGFVLMAGIGLIVAIVHRNGPALASLVVAVMTFLLFSRTQAMADHHFLPVALFLFPLIALPMVALLQVGSVLTRAAAGVIPILGAVAFMAAIALPTPNYGSTWGGRILPRQLLPLRLENIANYRALAERLQELVGAHQRIVMFASGVSVSDELFRVIQPSLSPMILPTPHIAEVDLFDFRQLSADFAVAVDPLPTHLGPHSQRHLVLANERLLFNTGFGAAFAPTGDQFMLAEGMIATIMRRTRPVTAAELDEFYQALLHAFPHWRDEPALLASRFESTISVISGDIYGAFVSAGLSSYSAHPGARTPTLVRFGNADDIGAPIAVHINVSLGGAGCESANGTGITLFNSDGPGQRRLLAPGETAELPFPEPRLGLGMMIDNNGDPTCDNSFVKFVRPHERQP